MVEAIPPCSWPAWPVKSSRSRCGWPGKKDQLHETTRGSYRVRNDLTKRFQPVSGSRDALTRCWPRNGGVEVHNPFSLRQRMYGGFPTFRPCANDSTGSI